MCETCGCGDPHLVSVEVQDRILSENDRQAMHNREHFVAAGVCAVNLMGSPGAGKTAVLEATAKRLTATSKLGAIAGDLATDHDAARLERAGVPSHSITTGNACHLDASMVHRALHHMPWSGLDYLFIENVGNLVCPAVYDLGEHADVVVLSVTEGEDKPLKYPVMFKKAELVIVTKVDLLPHLPGVSVEAIWQNIQRVMPKPEMVRFSAVTGEGVEEWVAWLAKQRAGTRRG
ncbi:MAG: hydrogenase nickel incorporation protein HypB [Acidobacteriota bacterium]